MLTLEDVEKLIENRRAEARKALILVAEIRELEAFKNALHTHNFSHIKLEDKRLQGIALSLGDRYKDLNLRTTDALFEDLSDAIERRKLALEAAL